ncbi:MAG TPA: sn-glycerol-3-phosphate ABC transporter ATP-binding protein UgpC [Flavisolibacter sp.]|nr:sn-glycerol-3-phosphate ABC transporter ATP-binding protein UgpC [Flavisolibacter sp.]
MAEVKLEHISKIYDDNKKKPGPKTIDDISFTVHDKEFLVIVGPSGCGKSTLLRMIAGLEEITGGNLLIDGARMNDKDPRDRDLAMVFQNYALYPHMTVYENMAFGLRLKRHSKTEIRERVLQTAQLLELEDELQRKPKSLSGGQRQRVAIGRAIIRRPKVFLFDEPLSNLDAKLRSQMRIELQKLHRDINATMIYVTHDQVEAMTLGTRIAVLNKGKLMQLDTPMHLYAHPANHFVAGFIGSPAMNFIRGDLGSGNEFTFRVEERSCSVQLENNTAAALKSFAGKGLIVGIRPEHIVLGEEDDRDTSFDCTLEVTAFENMGNEQLVYFKLQEKPLIVRQEPKEGVVFGQMRKVSFLRDKLLFIDPETGDVVNRNFLLTDDTDEPQMNTVSL